MSRQIDNNLFINFSFWPRFYQQLSRGIASYEALGNYIIEQIKIAKSFRKVEPVRELAVVLINIPIKEYKLIGQYYIIWCDCRESKFNYDALESIIDETDTYKFKALSTRGTFEWYKGNNEAAFYFYKEAFGTCYTASEYIDLSRCVAVLKAQEGFHKHAVKDLDNLLPVLRHAEPIVYHEFLNSYATELAEVGRIKEATGAIQIVLASPFVVAYPEWRETGEDIARRGYRASRWIMGFRKINPDNVADLADVRATRPSQPQIAEGRASVSSLAERVEQREEMAKKNKPQENSLEDEDEYERERGKLHRIVADPRTTGNQLKELLRYWEQLKSKQTEQK